MMVLLLEILNSDEQLSELVVCGVGYSMMELLMTHPEVGPVALQEDIHGVLVARLHKLGRPEDWMVRHACHCCVIDCRLYRQSMKLT